MNAVGIDASKGKSMVTILRPFGEIVSSPHEVKHTSDQIDDLIREIRSLEGESRIVMEYTGRYHEPMARWLSDAGLFVSLQRMGEFLQFYVKKRHGRKQIICQDWNQESESSQSQEKSLQEMALQEGNRKKG